MFLMIFQSLMGPRKSRCDIPNGTTQRWAFPINIPKFYKTTPCLTTCPTTCFANYMFCKLPIYLPNVTFPITFCN